VNYYLGPWQKGTKDPDKGAWIAPDGVIGCIDFRALSAQASTGVALFVVPDGVTLDSSYQLIGQGDLRDINVTASNRAALRSLLGLRANASGTKLAECLFDVLTMQADPRGQGNHKPLMPTMRRELEIYLAGQKVISRQFDLNSQEAANCIAVMQESYRTIREDARNGKLRDAEHHRRVLDFWGEKFLVNNPEDIFIPSGLPKESRIPHSTTITDNFNRADANPISNAGEGWTWTNVSAGGGGLRITSNTARNILPSYALNESRADSNLSSDDHYAQCSVPALGSDGLLGLCTRMESQNNYYFAGPYNGTNTLSVRRMAAASDTVLAGPSITLSLPEIYRQSIDGSTLKSYQAGVERDSRTDTTLTGTLLTGLRTWGATANTLQADDFQAADLGESPPAAVLMPQACL